MKRTQRGFSLIELMVVMVIFLIVSGAVFGLLNVAQVRYRSEQMFLESFQGARLGVDLMVRDIHNAGYPPPYSYAGNLPGPPAGPTPLGYPVGTWEDPLAAPVVVQRRFAVGIVGLDGAGSPSTTCTVNTANPAGSTCRSPNPWDLVMELDVNPEDGAQQVEWLRYQLVPPAGAGQASTLLRSLAAKNPGANVGALLQTNVPFVENIVQNPNVALNAVMAMGDGTNAVNSPLFTYECDPAQVNPPGSTICTAEHIKNVYIIMLVRGARTDTQTGRFARITLRGAASRQYPSR